jgi:hypothetical protein
MIRRDIPSIDKSFLADVDFAMMRFSKRRYNTPVRSINRPP